MSRQRPLQSSFVLHTRKYRDTSLLVEIFSRDEGRYTLVARGARSRKPRYHLQLFAPVLVSTYGRGELKTARDIEANGSGYLLAGRNLMIALYVNELLYRLVGKYEPLPEVFDRYKKLINLLQAKEFPIAMLREFELSLLSDLGYGISFDVEAGTGDPIRQDCRYRFVVEDGFHYLAEGAAVDRAVEGKYLLAIAEGNIDAKADGIAKWVIRQSVDQLLNGSPLHSRKLFAS